MSHAFKVGFFVALVLVSAVQLSCRHGSPSSPATSDKPTPTAATSPTAAAASAPALDSSTRSLKTFCNPLDLDYGVRRTTRDGALVHRHGADPVIVLYNDKYYLFSTWDRAGYRVSDDLLHWKTILFTGDESWVGQVYTAPAVVEMDGWLYFLPFASRQKVAPVLRTRDPDSGNWEKVAEVPMVADPSLFVDPQSQKLYLYHGLDQPIQGLELDKMTFQEVPGTRQQLMPPFDPDHIGDGWEICTWDNNPKSKGMRSTGTFNPCREGSWMTFHDGKYYLQYASPGTTVPGYADGVLVSDQPLGPFVYSQASPISHKDTGFITSAGHSCLFQDRHQNWWRAVTMLIGVNERFERRIGLFPAGFDKDGIPYTRTTLGDLPMLMPDGTCDLTPTSNVRAGWFVLSDGKPVTASSTLPTHDAHLANDENIRTWWCALTRKAGEWLQIDLGSMMSLDAVQINLAEQDLTVDPAVAATQPATDAHRFVLSASDDGKAWRPIVDKRNNSAAEPHTYVQFEEAVSARYLKLENVTTPGGGRFAVSDLRAFGKAPGTAPEAVSNVTVERNSADRRQAKITWPRDAKSTGYVIRYGIARDKLYQNFQLINGESTSVSIHSLNEKPGYFFRVDAMNDSGVTEGTSIVGAE